MYLLLLSYLQKKIKVHFYFLHNFLIVLLNEELKILGRIHTFEQFLKTYDMARLHGFGNINVDLISAIPRQTLSTWEESLTKIIELNPEHISAYSLIIEEGTPFARLYGEGTEGEKELPSEEEEREIYKRTEELLNKAGYERYEISNYAKPGKECKHNLGYWDRKNYLGLGLGASSLIEESSKANTSSKVSIFLSNFISFKISCIRGKTLKEFLS